MNQKYFNDAAWACMTLAAVAAVAAQQDWASLKGAIVGVGLCLAALGAACKTPPQPSSTPGA